MGATLCEDRLAAAVGCGGAPAERYTYDPAGNRLTDHQGRTYDYDPQTHRMTRMGSTTYQYDARGHQTQENDGQGTVTDYTWDALGQLVRVTENSGAKIVDYRYDAVGRRIAATITEGGTVTAKEWAYDGLDLIEFALDGVLSQEYVHGPGIDNPWAYLEHDGAGVLVRYYHADLLGSIRLITDGAGDVVQAYDYTSFGETTECIFPFPFQPFQYAAREDDPDSKLDYNRARYYNPRAGRFISPDPLGAAGGRTNRFLYVGNSPTRFKDPSGLDYFDINFTIPLKNKIGVTAGFLVDGSNNVYAYYGLAAATGFGASLTYSPNDVTLGWNLLFSIGHMGMAFAGSYPLLTIGEPAFEVGVAIPGITIGVAYVEGPLEGAAREGVLSGLRQLLYRPTIMDPALFPNVQDPLFGPGGLLDPWFGPAGVFRNMPPPDWLVNDPLFAAWACGKRGLGNS